MTLVNRPVYLKKIASYKDKIGIIKVITGIRRCGKSTLFKLYQNYLLENGVKSEQIISINLDNIDNIDLLNPNVLYDHIKSKLTTKMNYVFLDEIQNVDKFQFVLNSLNEKDNIDLYVTGSNAFLLSNELATLISGRYVQIKMYTLSFKEYLSFYDSNISREQKFANYLTYGSFPYILNCKDNEEQILDYLDSLYNAIIVKDIMQRGKITDIERLKKVLLFLSANIGSLVSINNIKNQMINDNFKISVQTIENYISTLSDSYIIHKVPRYNIKSKELLKTNDKYYIADMGFRYYLLREKGKDRKHTLENIVYLELLKRGYNVYVGKINELEVDFIAENFNKKMYIQVTETLMGEDTRKRELRSLEGIRDNYEKIILSMDNVFLGDIGGGIQHKNIIDWLLE